MKTIELTDSEHTLLTQMLRDLLNYMGNSRCNDLVIPNTEGNREIYKAIKNPEDPEVDPKAEYIYCMDMMVLNHLLEKIKKPFTIPSL